MQRPTPADALSEPHKKELRFFVRSLLEQAEDFEAKNILKNTGGNAPGWYHAGNEPAKSYLKFEYQSSIGRDGFEPDPIEPVTEFFGPFKIDYATHTILLENWNLLLGTKIPRYGMGNLIVGTNQSYTDARNGVIVGKDNTLRGSYGVVAGEDNFAMGKGAVVAGGFQNKVRAEYASVMGGQLNNATIHFATSSGGYRNMASAPFSTVGGGAWNVADGFSSFIAGGKENKAMANLSVVIGGWNNAIPDLAVSETLLGGKTAKAPTPEPPEDLTIWPGEFKEAKDTDLNYKALGCKTADGCQQEEEEEEEDEEDEDNPAKQKRLVPIGEVTESGDSRRRTVHDEGEEEEDMAVLKPPE